MNKIISCFLLTVLFIILSCCVTNKIIHDKSIPTEQLCSLEIPNNMTITNFDGERVKWSKGFWGGSILVKIPAGEHELTVDYLSESHKGKAVYISSARDLKVKYNFKPEVNHKLQSAVILNRITVNVVEIYR